MMTIGECVSILRNNSVRSPEIPSTEGLQPMVFASSASSVAATEQECDAATHGNCPANLMQFWRLARTARLFEDVTSGQWGLEILSPDDAAKATRKFKHERARDFAQGDLIAGRFIGDSNLLLIRCDPQASDFGSVVVAGPIDPRADWDTIARSFGEFLNRYIAARGDMYWCEGPENQGGQP